MDLNRWQDRLREICRARRAWRLDQRSPARAASVGVLLGFLGVASLPLLGVTHGALFLAPSILLLFAFWVAWCAGPVALLQPEIPERAGEPQPQATAQPIQIEPATAQVYARTASPTARVEMSVRQVPDLSFLPEAARPDLDLVSIPEGSFRMGSPEGVGDKDERPQHRVSVPAFLCLRYPVTVCLYRAVMGSEGEGVHENDRRPVTEVSCWDAIAFCNRLSERAGLRPGYDQESGRWDPAADGFRLPTEAEWEYVARAGTETAWYWGDDESGANAHAWYSSNSDGRTHPVGEKAPNAWGLHATAGNVWEWVEDCWHDNYAGAPADGSAWLHANGGDCGRRVLRGGSWGGYPDSLRSAGRSRLFPDLRFGGYYGFRVVRRPRSPSSTEH